MNKPSVPGGYFDYAAASPLDPIALEAMWPFLAQDFYNPSPGYEPARKVKAALQAARQTVAEILGAKSSEIIFTAGGSEANNLAIHGVMRSRPEANMIVSDIEHESVIGPSEHYQTKVCPVSQQGIVDEAKLEKLIDAQTVLISIMQANNEIGSIQPIKRITAVIKKERLNRKKAGNQLPLYFHTDAAQAGNYLDVHVHRLGVDMMTINGGKIYGPKQSGVLFVCSGVELEPLIDGGGQERGLRAGTENVAGAVGLSIAFKQATDLAPIERERLGSLQQYFYKKIAEKLPQASINGTKKNRLPNNINLVIPGQDNERLLILLDEQGVFVTTGSACSASNEKPSRTLRAIGLSDQAIRSSLRFSMGRKTTKDDVDYAIAKLEEVAQ